MDTRAQLAYFQMLAGVLYRRLNIRGLPRVRELTDAIDPKRTAWGMLRNGIIYLRLRNPQGRAYKHFFVRGVLLHEIAHKFAHYHTPKFKAALRRVQRALHE